MSKQMLELCPFCKSEETSVANTGSCWVRCLSVDCGAEGPVKDTEEDAIAAWNGRCSAVSEHAQRVSRDAIERAIHPFCFSGKNSDAIADAVLSLFNEPQAAPDEAVADQIVGQIEERFPDWRSYRDLIDCIDCTLHRLRADAYSQAVSDEGKS